MASPLNLTRAVQLTVAALVFYVLTAGKNSSDMKAVKTADAVKEEKGSIHI